MDILFSVFLQSLVGYAARKRLDVVFDCNGCNTRVPQKITNVQNNDLRCKNCGKHIRQFTNACDFTVANDRSISHVGVFFSTELDFIKSGERVIGGRKNGCYRFKNFKGKEIREFKSIFDSSNGKELSRERVRTWIPKGNDFIATAEITVIRDTLWRDRSLELQHAFLSPANDKLYFTKSLIKRF